ncbi:MAG: zinc ABC transporter substrate-binding protein [Thermoleophilia bacterium]|nr:zinc ABC transporter substrate-binding protein [Thermoleophilia bacterium]
MPRRLLALLPLAAVAVAAGCGGGAASERTERPRVVVTYSILGSLVTELVGEAADVTVLMPDGVDPHDWQPSAKDVEAIQSADLVAANGLDLEEGIDDALAEAERSGVPVFRAADHVDVRTVGEGETGHGEEHEGDEHGAGSPDPHIWTSPLAMRSAISALAAALAADAGIDVSGRAAQLEARLTELDGELERLLATVPEGRRQLVTGHESMGYFADRYGFVLVGAVVPGLSSQAEASAADLAELKGQIERAGATVVFTEIGTPVQVAEAIASETGAAVVELPSHSLPDDGSYFTFMRGLATAVADALAAG